MNIKRLHFVSSVIIIILLLFMGFNILIMPLSDWVVRVIGVVLMFDLVFFTYLSVSLMKRNINNKKLR
jgi:hypothetical protein